MLWQTLLCFASLVVAGAQGESRIDATFEHNRAGLAYLQWTDEQFARWTRVRTRMVRVQDSDGRPLANTQIRGLLSFRSASDVPCVVSRALAARTDGKGLVSFMYHARLGIPPLWANSKSKWVPLGELESASEESESQEISLQVRRQDRQFRFQIRNLEEVSIPGSICPQLYHGAEEMPWDKTYFYGGKGTTVLDGFHWGGWWALVGSPGYAQERICPYQFMVGDDDSRMTVVRLRRSVSIDVSIPSDSTLVHPIWIRSSYLSAGFTTSSEFWAKLPESRSATIEVPRSVESQIILVDAVGRVLECSIRTESKMAISFVE